MSLGNAIQWPKPHLIRHSNYLTDVVVVAAKRKLTPEHNHRYWKGAWLERFTKLFLME